jgi:hypothetical protein
VITRIGRARQALRDACVGGQTPAERVHLWPQTGQYPTPCAWVGLPIVRSARSSTTLTIPVIVLVDGNAEAQMAALDDELSRIWDALRKVKHDGVMTEVVSAVPDMFGPEGSSTRGVTFTCTVELATLTLCDGQRLVDPS